MDSNQPSLNIPCDKDTGIWKDKPGELAIFAYNYLKESQSFRNRKDIFILDLGCGNGQDAIFLAERLPCHILGLDNSRTAIENARKSLPANLIKRIELLCYDFSEVNDKYDVIFVSNLYHLLKADERAKLKETVKRCLKSDGVIFLSAFSAHKPQISGKSSLDSDESDVSPDEKCVHFFTREELEKDFDFLNVNALYERDNFESHINPGANQISWIMLGRLK